MPAFFAGNRKLRPAFDRIRECVYLLGVDQKIGDVLSRNHLALAAQLDFDRMLYVQSVICKNNAGFTDYFKGSTILRAI